jgi:hypothetical protein
MLSGRRAFSLSLVLMAVASYLDRTRADQPAPPQAPGIAVPPISKPDKTVTTESYAALITQLQNSAREYANKHGRQLSDAEVKNIENVTKGAIITKGYSVPMPPTNFRVEVQ